MASLIRADLTARNRLICPASFRRGILLLMVRQFINLNGKLLPADQPVVSGQSHAFRYGDGIFETIRMDNRHMPFFELHMDRLFRGMSVLQFETSRIFTPSLIQQEIEKLVQKNKLSGSVRIRLTIFRGEGGLFDPVNHHPNYLIEAHDLPDQYNRLNENGLVLEVFDVVRKQADVLSGFKTCNHLPYVLAAIDAKKRRVNECLVLNTSGRICDASISNIFWVKEGEIFTPPLSEGGIDGVMRRFLLSNSLEGFTFSEKVLPVSDLMEADEVFLTNALYKIRWVQQCRDKQYNCLAATAIFRQLS